MMLKRKIETGVTMETWEKGEMKTSAFGAMSDYILEFFCMMLVLYASVCGLFASCHIEQNRKCFLSFMFLITMVTFAVVRGKNKYIMLLIYLAASGIMFLILRKWIWFGVKYFMIDYIKFVNGYFGT